MLMYEPCFGTRAKTWSQCVNVAAARLGPIFADNGRRIWAVETWVGEGRLVTGRGLFLGCRFCGVR